MFERPACVFHPETADRGFANGNNMPPSAGGLVWNISPCPARRRCATSTLKHAPCFYHRDGHRTVAALSPRPDHRHPVSGTARPRARAVKMARIGISWIGKSREVRPNYPRSIVQPPAPRCRWAMASRRRATARLCPARRNAATCRSRSFGSSSAAAPNGPNCRRRAKPTAFPAPPLPRSRLPSPLPLGDAVDIQPRLDRRTPNPRRVIAPARITAYWRSSR